jgi:hypothetical protein
MARGGWDKPPSEFRETIDDDVGTHARVAAMAMLQEVVFRSPVGNPDLWQANTQARSKAVSLANAYDELALSQGRKKLTKRERNENFYVNDFSVGKGYVGGRFRGNNFVTIDEPGYYQLERVDPGGSQTISAGSSAINAAPAYSTIYIQNNLPYAEPLENGHSTQAPGGIYAVSFHGVSQAYSK